MGKKIHKLSQQANQNQNQKNKTIKRKIRKEQNSQLRGLNIMKKNKNVGLPNLAIYKKKIVESFENKKQTPKNIEKLNMLKTKFDNQQVFNKKNEESMLQEQDEIYNENNPLLREKKKYMRELKKVLEASDIVLEILDARDPLGCRNKEIEALIQSMPGEKKIILVVNKIDLVPVENAELWLNHLRREYATVLFKSNTQSQNQNLSGATLFKKTFHQNVDMTEQMLSSNKAVGADNLLQLIKNYSKKEGVKYAVSVGLIGYPNVGKSSVINSLKRAKSVGVSNVPGFTKHMQEVVLDKKVKLLDCPGVVFSGDEEAQMVLRNIIKLEHIVDPISPIGQIIEKGGAQTLKELYKIQQFGNTTDFIVKVGQARGQLQKGGAIDMEKTARLIINDWNSGKIKFFTTPPQESKMILE